MVHRGASVSPWNSWVNGGLLFCACFATCVPAAAQGGKPYITEEMARSAGPGHPWQGGPSGVNLYSLAKQTSIPLIGWRNRGGLPMGLVLYHNSQAVGSNLALGKKWQHSHDTHLRVWMQLGIRRAALVWGNHTVQTFEQNPNWASTDGYRSRLQNAGLGYDVTLPSQTVLHFNPVPHGSAVSLIKRYRLDSITDPNGNQIQYLYDGLSRLIRVDDSTGRALVFNYGVTQLDSVAFTTPGGYSRIWTFIYDNVNRLVRINLPTVTTNAGPQNYDVEVGYDANNNVIAITDPEGMIWTFGYNGNRIAFEQWPANTAAERVLYQSSANLRTINDPWGSPLTFEYDGLSRLIRRRDASFFDIFFDYLDPDYSYGVSKVLMPSGDEHRCDYDSNGNVVGAINPAGERWDYMYDSRNNLIRALAPLVTDAFGNVEAGRHRTDYIYDANSNLIRREQYWNPTNFHTTLYAYDAAGQLISCTNALNRTWTYEYDPYGNLIRSTTPMGRSVRSFFDTAALSNGFVNSNAWSDANGLRTELIRDEWGRLRRVDFLSEPDRLYSYDAMNRLVRMVDSTGQIDSAYNPNGWLMSTIKGAWFCNYTYFSNGLKKTELDDSGTGPHPITYNYDPRGLLSTITDIGTTSTFSYDANGRLTTRLLGNTADSMYGYANGRLAGVTQHDRVGGIISSPSYSYQDDGRLARVTTTGSITRYQYDWLGRLVREERNAAPAYNHLYTYDAVGNRIQQNRNGQITNIQYDPDNNIVQALPQGGLPETYNYDNNGRLVQRVRNNNAEVFQFGYDTSGNLTSMQQYNGMNFVPYANYTYNGMNLRDGRNTFQGGNPFEQDKYHIPIELVSLSLVSCEPIRVDKVIQGQPSTEVNTWAGGLIRVNDLNGGEYWPATDGLGNKRGHTDASGNDSTSRTVYNAFGEVMFQQGPQTVHQFGADRGVRTEGDAGIEMENGGLFYDPKLGSTLPTGPNILPDGTPSLADLSLFLSTHVGSSGQAGRKTDSLADSFFDVFFLVDLPAIQRRLPDGSTLLLPAIQRRLPDGSTLLPAIQRRLPDGSTLLLPAVQSRLPNGNTLLLPAVQRPGVVDAADYVLWRKSYGIDLWDHCFE